MTSKASRRRRARRSVTATAALALSCAATFAAAPSAGAAPLDSHCTESDLSSGAMAECQWNVDGQIDHFTVPAAVGTVHVTAIGGAGGNISAADGNFAGGTGAQVDGDLSVSGIDTLLIAVGGNGAGIGDGGSCDGSSPCAGGFNGGGSGGAGSGSALAGAGGGGLTQIVDASSHARLVTAGGGGGASDGGGLGGAAGATPANGTSVNPYGYGGAAASSSNSLGTAGGTSDGTYGGGGGGGAGQSGGGGGSAGTGGGAGSSLVPAGGDFQVSSSPSETGSLSMYYTLNPDAVAMNCGTLTESQSTTCTITVTPTSGSATVAPTGVVRYVDNITSPLCTLSADGTSDPATASCTVTLDPAQTGPASGRVIYVGDDSYAQATNSFSAEVAAPVNSGPTPPPVTTEGYPSLVQLNCPTQTLYVYNSCDVNISGEGPTAPTGTVTLHSEPGGQNYTCTLVNQGCTMSFPSQSPTDQVTLTFTYSGDSVYKGSVGYAEVVLGFAASSLIRNVSRPAIHGNSKVGDRLSCSAGRWQGRKLKYTYAWKRNGKKLKGQTASHLKVVGADRGHSLICTVTAHAGGAAVSASSRPRHIPAARGHRR